MIETFVDTSYLLALVLNDDEHHERAKRWNDALTGRLVLHEFVLVEFADALSNESLRSLVPSTITIIRHRPAFRILPASPELLNAGLELFAARRDKPWSLTDCISFAVMRREGMNDALSSDHHFEQAGFRALLRSDPRKR